MKKRGKRQTKPQDSMDEDKNHHHDIIWAYKKKNIWSEGPYENASLFSLCFFNWVNPMLKVSPTHPNYTPNPNESDRKPLKFLKCQKNKKSEISRISKKIHFFILF